MVVSQISRFYYALGLIVDIVVPLDMKLERYEYLDPDSKCEFGIKRSLSCQIHSGIIGACSQTLVASARPNYQTSGLGSRVREERSGIHALLS